MKAARYSLEVPSADIKMDFCLTITKNPNMKAPSHEVKSSGTIISRIKNRPDLLFLSFVFFLVWSACKESEDPIPPPATAPTLTGFSPTSGAIGTVVTLTGTNFSTTLLDNTVKFNGTVATVSAATAISLTVAVPPGATTGKISVEVDNQIGTSSNDFTVVATVAPLTLTSFSPTTGTAGTIVTLAGTNFSPTIANNTVKFNGTAATVSVATATSLTVEVPAVGTTGKITVQVGNQTATSADDFVYVANTSANKNTVVTVAGNGSLGFADGDIDDARFYQPTGIAVDTDGNMYVADAENHRIRKITPGGVVSTLAGSGTSGSADGVGTAAQFYSPRAVAVDATGNIYVADGINNKIRKITPAGEVSTLAGSGASGFADGQGTSAKFYFPKGIAVDASGNIYVADDINHRIRKITPTGTVSTIAGSTVGVTEGIGTAAKFNTPVGIAVDASGNIYVADDENERIRKITTNGTVSTLAGGFLQGFTDGVGGDAQFRSPTGLAIDASGNIYVADRHNHSIRKIQ
jgi:sugar lactone lactonase YvrE